MKYSILTICLLLIQMINIPDHFSVTYQGKEITSGNKADLSISLIDKSIIDSEKYDQFTDKINHIIYKAPINAIIDDHGHIVREQTGLKLDQEMFTKQFYSYFFGSGSVIIEVPVLTLYPKVDSELLGNIRSKKIGEYITYYNKRKKGRVHNINLAIEAINNYVIFPGETFSFNEAVGSRTLEKGYLPAPVIIKGKVYEGVGGGICQVSSTLFNAVDQAGVQILERYSHSKRVPYVPPGRDATVSWYGPDFTFKNNHNQPLLIQARAVSGRVIVQVFSSDVINFNSDRE